MTPRDWRALLDLMAYAVALWLTVDDQPAARVYLLTARVCRAGARALGAAAITAEAAYYREVGA